MKKWLLFLTILVAGLAQAVPQSQVLSDLGAAGVTEQGGSSMYAHYLVRLGTNGTFSLSTMPAVFQSPAWSRVCYIDALTGQNQTGVVGTPAAPYATLGYALTNYPYRTNQGVVYLMGPGTYDSVTIDPVANPGCQNLTLYGYDPVHTVVPYLNFYNGSGGTAVQIALSGIQVQSLRQGNNRPLAIQLVDRSIVGIATMAYGSTCTVSRTPEAQLGSCSGALRDILIDTATNIGFNCSVPADWVSLPTNAAQALNLLAARQRIMAGQNPGDLLYWAGTAWTNLATGSNQFLVGGAVPSWTNQALAHGSATGQVAVWTGSIWTNSPATTNTGWVLFGGTNPAWAAIQAYWVAYGTNTVQGALQGLGVGLSQEVVRATGAETAISNIAQQALSGAALVPSVESNTAFRLASTVNLATNAINATYAQWAITSLSTATNAIYAATASYATNSGTASYATNSGTASYATNSGTASYATNSGTASYATNSGTASYATNSGTASYATNAGTASYATNSYYATNSGYAVTAGSATNAGYATTAGTASYATNSYYATNAGYAATAGTASNAIGAVTNNQAITYLGTLHCTALYATNIFGNGGLTNGTSYTNLTGLSSLVYPSTANLVVDAMAQNIVLVSMTNNITIGVPANAAVDGRMVQWRFDAGGTNRTVTWPTITFRIPSSSGMSNVNLVASNTISLYSTQYVANRTNWIITSFVWGY